MYISALYVCALSACVHTTWPSIYTVNHPFGSPPACLHCRLRLFSLYPYTTTHTHTHNPRSTTATTPFVPRARRAAEIPTRNPNNPQMLTPRTHQYPAPRPYACVFLK